MAWADWTAASETSYGQVAVQCLAVGFGVVEGIELYSGWGFAANRQFDIGRRKTTRWTSINPIVAA